MTKPARYDLHIGRGNNNPVRIRFLDSNGDVININGYRFDLAVTWDVAGAKRGSLRVSTAVGGSGLVVDAGRNEVQWTPTLPDSRRIPECGAVYDLEARFSDTQRTLMVGNIFTFGGANPDA